MAIFNVVGGAALQDAINVANSGDEILVDDGVYSPITFSGRNIKIIIKSLNGPDNCIIDAGTYYEEETNSWIGIRGIEGYSYYNQTIDGFTIRNCGSYSENTPLYGGGAHNVKLINCKIYNNIASQGGGCYGCYLDHCEIYNNRAAKGGGCFAGEIYFSKIYENNADLIDTSTGGGTQFGQIYYSEIYNNYQYSTNGNYAGGGCDSSHLYFCYVHDNQSEVSKYVQTKACHIWSSLIIGSGTSIELYNSTIISNKDFCTYVGSSDSLYRNSIFIFTGSSGRPLQAISDSRKNYEYCLVYPYQSNVLDNPGMLNGVDPMLDENYKPIKDSPVIGAANPEYIMTEWDLARRRWNKDNPSIGCYEYKLNNFNLPNSLYPMVNVN